MMFKSTAIFLTLTAALELVLASSVSITSPEANAIWEAGSIVEIKWYAQEHHITFYIQVLILFSYL